MCVKNYEEKRRQHKIPRIHIRSLLWGFVLKTSNSSWKLQIRVEMGRNKSYNQLIESQLSSAFILDHPPSYNDAIKNPNPSAPLMPGYSPSHNNVPANSGWHQGTQPQNYAPVHQMVQPHTTQPTAQQSNRKF